MIRINVGCGCSPTSGWRNFDNSISLRLSKIKLLPSVLHKLRLVDGSQYKFIEFARNNDIEYGDATKGLPIPDGSCDVIYTSHMMEHLDRSEVKSFLNESYRILRPGGIMRIAIPDLLKQVSKYTRDSDADAFLEGMSLCAPRPRSFAHKLRIILVGTRHHQWMYDGESLVRILQKHGFTGAEIMPSGKTKIHNHESLDLKEREDESVYVEAFKPNE